jgi:hypothetical protein
MLKITGLDRLHRQIEEAQKALEALDGDLGTVHFDPNDPASIEQAIQDVERIVDEKSMPYAENALIAPLIEQMKERYREAIVDRAAALRLKGGNE